MAEEASGPRGAMKFVPLLLAVSSPMLASVVYVIDKLAVSRRVLFNNSYIALVGIVDIAFGLVTACLVRWKDVRFRGVMSVVWPVGSGVLFGVATVLYLFALDGADVSRVVGLENTYPLIVTLLSFVVLKEAISLLGYAGIALTVSGGLILSVDLVPLVASRVSRWRKKRREKEKRETPETTTPAPTPEPPEDDAILVVDVMVPEPVEDARALGIESLDPKRDEAELQAAKKAKKTSKRKLMLLVIPLIIVEALSEFMTKLSTEDTHPLAVSAISYVSYGVFMSTVLFLPSARVGFFRELKRNWFMPVASELLMMASNIAMTYAMADLPAPIVSSICSSAPFFVLFLEFVFRIAGDSVLSCLGYKLLPVTIVIAGIALLSIATVG